MKEQEMCRIPIRATYRIGPGGEARMVKEESVFADIPADTIARFLLEKFGRSAILGEVGD